MSGTVDRMPPVCSVLTVSRPVSTGTTDTRCPHQREVATVIVVILRLSRTILTAPNTNLNKVISLLKKFFRASLKVRIMIFNHSKRFEIYFTKIFEIILKNI